MGREGKRGLGKKVEIETWQVGGGLTVGRHREEREGTKKIKMCYVHVQLPKTTIATVYFKHVQIKTHLNVNLKTEKKKPMKSGRAL